MRPFRGLTLPASHDSPRARARVRAGLLWGAAVAGVVTAIVFPEELTYGPGPVLALVAFVAVLGATAGVSTFWPAWDRYGGLAGIALIAGTVALTGGPSSPFHILFLLNGVFGALFYPRRRLAAESIAAIAALLAPLVYTADRTLASEVLPHLVFEAAAYAAIIAIVHVQTANRTDAQDRLYRSEAEARRSSRRLEMLVEAVPLPFVELDLDDRVRRWNPAAERTFGWTADEVVGRTLPTVAPDDVDQHRDLWALVLAGETVSGAEVTRRHRDGRPLDVSIFTGPVHDEDGRIRGALVFYLDLTERNALERQLRHAQKMEAIGRLAGGVAHDFNNLLTIIAGTAEFALGADGLDEELRHDLDEMRAAAHRGSRIVDELLGLGQRRGRGGGTVEPAVALAELAPALHRLVEDRGELSIGAERCEIAMDPDHFEQVVLNLVINARDALADTGTITISVEAAGESDGSKDEALLRVTDTGTGIQPDVLDHIFEPFFTTKPVGEGTGLGLSTLYGMVDQYGGRTEVSSEVGRGTTFSIHLPLVVEPADGDRRDDGERFTGDETVLVVDDEPGVRNLVCRTLGSQGYTALEAIDGVDALRILDGGAHVDLVVTDMVMPELDGAGLTAQLRERYPGVRILLMSGFAADTVTPRADDGRPSRVLAKPFTTRALLSTVRESLDAVRS